MTLHLHVVPLLTLAAGVLVLVRPQWLHYVVGLYLIALGLFGTGGLLGHYL